MLDITKLMDKAKDTNLKLETLQDEIAAATRLNAQLQQDNFRLTSALDTLKRKKKGLELPGNRGKVTAHAATLSQSPVPKKPRHRGKASSNPLEYVDNVEVSQAPLQTARGAQHPKEPSNHDSDLDLDGSFAEMPSVINKLEGDEFLQGDSFLVDALSLQNRP